MKLSVIETSDVLQRDAYQQSEWGGSGHINHFKIFSFPDQNDCVARRWPGGASRQGINSKNLATHRDSIAAWMVVKFAPKSVGDTNSVPFGHPCNGEVEVFFSSWHAL